MVFKKKKSLDNKIIKHLHIVALKQKFFEFLAFLIFYFLLYFNFSKLPNDFSKFTKNHKKSQEIAINLMS